MRSISRRTFFVAIAGTLAAPRVSIADPFTAPWLGPPIGKPILTDVHALLHAIAKATQVPYHILVADPITSSRDSYPHRTIPPSL